MINDHKNTLNISIIPSDAYDCCAISLSFYRLNISQFCITFDLLFNIVDVSIEPLNAKVDYDMLW